MCFTYLFAEFFADLYPFSVKWHDAFSDSAADLYLLADDYCHVRDPGNFKYAAEFWEQYGNVPAESSLFRKAVSRIAMPDLPLDSVYWFCEHIREQSERLPAEEAEQNRRRLLVLLERAVFLASNNQIPFSGTLQRMQLLSQYDPSHCYWDSPKEVSQKLIIQRSGQISLHAKTAGKKPQETPPGRRLSFSADQTAIHTLLQKVAEQYSVLPTFSCALDGGGWELELTNTNGRSFLYSGSIPSSSLFPLSGLIRQTLEIDSLFLFDGYAHPQ